MKKVASSIKLDLAQYRELANFAQFGSDVDDETKTRLEHGRILMEILKQPQYQPIPVERQIMIIYAAVNKYLTEIGADNVKVFEKRLYALMSEEYPHVGNAIRDTGVLDEANEKQLIEGIERLKKEMKRELGIKETEHGEAD